MKKRILVTGATGFLGRHALPRIREAFPESAVTGVCSADYDLMIPDQVAAMFRDIDPEVVVHLAAYSGGIGANRAYPADFYFRNTILTALTFEAAARHGVQKLVYPMGGCSYPATATSPISEDQMWQGFPQPDSAGYSSAKKMGIVASKSYRTQYGLSSVVMIPGNMYGEFDNFRKEESHVVPAMIRRFYEARLNGTPEVAMWGTGKATRDFVYAGDVAATIPYFISTYDSDQPVNISSGTTTTIRELAETICELSGYEGTIAWDPTKPEGQLNKIFSVEKMHAEGLKCDTSLRDGVRRTIAWFAEHYADASDGLRI